MTSCTRPPKAVAGLNAFLADVEERAIIQRAPVPHDFPRTPLPSCELVDHCLCGEELTAAGMPCRKRGEAVPPSDGRVDGLGELVGALAEHPDIIALADELLAAGLMWVCEGCGGASTNADGVCSCGTPRRDTSSHEKP